MIGAEITAQMLGDGLRKERLSASHLDRFDWHRPALKVLLGRSKAWRLGTGAVSALGLA